jgi:hypothetical protein
VTSRLAWLSSACLLIAGLASAQPANPAPAASGATEPDGFIERQQARLDKLRDHGIGVTLGSILPGSSFAIGGTYAQERTLGTPIGGSISAAYSIRGYADVDVRLGQIKGCDHRAELNPVDADLTHVFNDHDLLVFGPALYLDVRQRDYPRMDYFGLGQASELSGRSDFRVRGPSVDLVGQWQHNRHIGVSGRVGTLRLTVQPGTNHGVPNIDTVYTADTAPGLDTPHRYHVAGAAITVDFRDQAHLTTRGTFAGAAVWYGAAKEVDDPSLSWARMIGEVRHFVRLHGLRHVLALRGLISARLDDASVPMPFYLEPTLGGTKTLRGFGSYRLRDDNAWAGTAEYRWRPNDRIEIAPFVDVGAVAAHVSDFGETRPAATPGIGLRGTTSSRVIVRLDLAHGRDGSRLMLTLSSPF